MIKKPMSKFALKHPLKYRFVDAQLPPDLVVPSLRLSFPKDVTEALDDAAASDGSEGVHSLMEEEIIDIPHWLEVPDVCLFGFASRLFKEGVATRSISRRMHRATLNAARLEATPRAANIGRFRGKTVFGADLQDAATAAAEAIRAEAELLSPKWVFLNCSEMVRDYSEQASMMGTPAGPKGNLAGAFRRLSGVRGEPEGPKSISTRELVAKYSFAPLFGPNGEGDPRKSLPGPAGLLSHDDGPMEEQRAVMQRDAPDRTLAALADLHSRFPEVFADVPLPMRTAPGRRDVLPTRNFLATALQTLPRVLVNLLAQHGAEEEEEGGFAEEEGDGEGEEAEEGTEEGEEDSQETDEAEALINRLQSSGKPFKSLRSLVTLRALSMLKKKIKIPIEALQIPADAAAQIQNQGSASASSIRRAVDKIRRVSAPWKKMSQLRAQAQQQQPDGRSPSARPSFVSPSSHRGSTRHSQSSGPRSPQKRKGRLGGAALLKPPEDHHPPSADGLTDTDPTAPPLQVPADPFSFNEELASASLTASPSGDPASSASGRAAALTPFSSMMQKARSIRFHENEKEGQNEKDGGPAKSPLSPGLTPQQSLPSDHNLGQGGLSKGRPDLFSPSRAVSFAAASSNFSREELQKRKSTESINTAITSGSASSPAARNALRRKRRGGTGRGGDPSPMRARPKTAALARHYSACRSMSVASAAMSVGSMGAASAVSLGGLSNGGNQLDAIDGTSFTNHKQIGGFDTRRLRKETDPLISLIEEYEGREGARQLRRTVTLHTFANPNKRAVVDDCRQALNPALRDRAASASAFAHLSRKPSGVRPSTSAGRSGSRQSSVAGPRAMTAKGKETKFDFLPYKAEDNNLLHIAQGKVPGRELVKGISNVEHRHGYKGTSAPGYRISESSDKDIRKRGDGTGEGGGKGGADPPRQMDRFGFYERDTRIERAEEDEKKAERRRKIKQEMRLFGRPVPSRVKEYQNGFSL
uniref:Uncharacterized protein n=1 Tax=Chromera velia CCMP2878 TaxID=1169474 RepID=A0A0G4HK14_9ALVE|eukprot:Cvel_7148.t1-p1 / transcript=Cvel_7148.t1 / gene=Cvel_7148 / organism=Chromera_velia_CCMP2878 / gene_product=hypothetical protein / transcript_product=hypothetical protein / location=Cvel_scaffold367:65368-72534(+) / protein_length=982 / sequence_SO=supercontig / SO=protein_coding / is_pseudo=false